ncbi:LPS O-antigen length regulator [Catenovulum sp. SM1970]|uniref:Wzz/FepE/Etk N-terminal domain-containing protein n=1 Tax=Marinifaba aquimaris TaxID=2741323 RepID=UPI001574BE74|nr:Wzz/FepE/Etk N-terminal domain-containing protein [Marinifaba aquimaris]NTS76904.1 LPS O-antigen length regulator [Marinifaba aquimaris]
MTQHYVEDKDIIKFSFLIQVLWRWKFLIAFVVTLSAGASAFYAVSLPNVYRGELIAKLPDDQSGGAMGGLANKLGGLASLAGVNIGGGSGKVLDQVKDLVRSRSFLHAFIEKYDLTADILAVKGWEPSSRKLIYNEEIYDAENKMWTRTPPPNRQVIPTPWEAYTKLLSSITIEAMPKKSMLKLSVDHYSPDLAKKWVELLLFEINELHRQKSKQEAQASIEYLQKTLESTELINVRKVFYDLLEEQMKSDMLAEVRQEYVLETLAHAVLPEEKNHPSRAFICIVGTFLGGLLSIILAFIANAIFRVKD